MGESKLKMLRRDETLLSCAGVQTMAGRVQVRWETESAATPMGQLAYFIEFLTLSGLWSRWLEGCPLSYTSPNAPSKAEVLGTWMLSVLSGHNRYSQQLNPSAVWNLVCDHLKRVLAGIGPPPAHRLLENQPSVSG